MSKSFPFYELMKKWSMWNAAKKDARSQISKFNNFRASKRKWQFQNRAWAVISFPRSGFHLKFHSHSSKGKIQSGKKILNWRNKMKSIVSGCKSSRLNFENEIEKKKFVRMKKNISNLKRIIFTSKKKKRGFLWNLTFNGT